MPDPSDRTDVQRVLIADDHPLYREALRAVVPQVCPAAEMHDACCESEVLAQATSDAAFDLIVLDLNLPGATGLSCLKQVRERVLHTPILVVSALEDPATISEAVLAGATAYVPKSSSRGILLDAIRTTIAGGTYLPASAVVALRSADARKQHRDQVATQYDLTSRQLRVLDLLSQGMSNKRIARELGIAEITVKAHVSAILKKLGVENRVQAAMDARKLLHAEQNGSG
ncbi:MAG TPA: response regulator transcription factor [Steroidobacter sp.]|uniref:response regulator transcription factor n=1 Tax=Steroidobacter sp. TaxID=1978227 RepID=UPI002ED7D2CB